MTGKDGQVLPQCAAQLAVLEATGKQMNKAFGEMQQEFREMSKILQEQRISIGQLTGNTDRLTESVKKLNNRLDDKSKEIQQHENECIFYQVAKKKTAREITKSLKLETSVIPPDPTSTNEIDIVEKKILNLPKKVQTAIYVGIAIATIVGFIITFIH